MGEIPTISVTAKCLPEAWEKAVLAVWDDGIEVKTQYDKPEDPPSKDAMVIITISEPFAEPRIHKNFPGGPAELEAYRQEVVSGIHDHWIDLGDFRKWTYTYHERLFAYPATASAETSPPGVNQIGYIIDALARAGHTRRAQAITWIPTADIYTADPPCLQRIWCRLTRDTDTGASTEFSQKSWSLNMNAHWRSRDLYKAWFMNVYALTDLQRIIAEEVSKRLKSKVKVGRYVDITDSLHIYGSYFSDVVKEVEKMRSSPFTERAWPSSHPAFQAMTEEARVNLAKDVDFYARPNR